jgi:BirA family biotin operon repressor/biotin-[acetyl-CoA-carboxylase] ligase
MDVPLHQWPSRLERAIARRALSRVRRVFVCSEIDSTQDAARRLRARAGDLVTCGRQTGGRGRDGRTWLDTGSHGLAATFVIARDQPQRLSIAAAVAGAKAIESHASRSTARSDDGAPPPQDSGHSTIGIKWPNDLMIGGRKVGGVLIEQAGDLAYVGVGINVSQSTWPAELKSRAISLAQAGVEVDRVDLLESLAASLEDALALDDAALVNEFRSRDAMLHRRATFRHDARDVAGVVRAIDPMVEITVETDVGPRVLPAASTSVVSVEWEDEPR